jgi:hypothetical protein
VPRATSSTAATGGKGYTFADKVAAGFLVHQPMHMVRQQPARNDQHCQLARAFPLGAPLGFIAELHFETKESGRSLDDLHLVLQNGGATSRWSISIKSNRQLSGKGRPE